MTRCAVQQSINQQSAIRCRRNAESRIAIIRLQFDAMEMHEIAITRLQFDETEMYEVYTLIACAQHTIAWHYDGNFEHGSDDTTNLPKSRGQIHWYPRVPSDEAVRGCRRVHQRREPAQPPPLPERLGGNNILVLGHHSQRCCFHTDRPTQ
jgi:hypothetical protein